MCDAGHTSMAYFYFDFRDIKNKVRNAVAVAHPRDSDNVRQDIAIYFALNALLVHHVERLGGPEHQNCQSERSLV